MRTPFAGSWRTALRVARREIVRARGRSALVVAMIAVPVCGLGYAAATYDMFTPTPAERATRILGAADARIQAHPPGPILQDVTGDRWRPAQDGVHEGGTAPGEDEILAQLPPGSRVVPSSAATPDLRTATGGLAAADATAMDLTDPIHAGLVTLLDGRAPAAPDEVAMSPAARERFGDTIQDVDGDRTWTVVGTVEFPGDLGEKLVFAPGGLPGAAAPQDWLVDTPEPVVWADVRALNQAGLAVTSRAVLLDPPDAAEVPLAADEEETFSLVPVVVGLAILEIVLLAGPAFAVGARRRQRSLALVAANGGTRAHLRRMVLADGVLLGLAGAATGLILAVLLAVVTRPFAEQFAGARAGGYRFNPPLLAGIVVFAVVTGLLAAAVPAVAAARADVVPALAGRRGVLRTRRRWPAAGLLLVAVGAAVATGGANVAQPPVIAGGLAVAQIGLVLCTPTLLGVIARFGAVLPPAPRIALRDTARNRAASAPAISAVMAAVAGTVAIGVYLAGTDARERENYTASLPAGHIGVAFGLGFDVYRDDTPAKVRAALTEAAPGATVTEIREPVCPQDRTSTSCHLYAGRPDANVCPGEEHPPGTRAEVDALAADPRCADSHLSRTHINPLFIRAVGDRDSVVALTGASGAELEAAMAVLDRGGAIVADPFAIVDGEVTLGVFAPPDTNREIVVPGYLMPGAGTDIISEGAVRRAGFATAVTGMVAAGDEAPDVAVIDRLDAALTDAGSRTSYVERGPADDSEPLLYLLAAASALITLGAAAVATGLAAADGRADLTTLAAVGAAPGVRRMLSLSQSGVIAGLGSALGVVAGIGSGFAVLAATNLSRAAQWPQPTPYPLTVPWLNLLIVAVVPLVAMAGAGLLTRSRLPIERRRPS
ncbi:FtsX-like permease family protein [Actinoplanes sp. NBRC 101535]|uniref:FtsX-like permease family protein n=1 Tax=Actinoplanes sp. NBRC 101535 TaxID=3032196 RepID=UPI0024A3AA65|nr:FtsX-like permease family protein [Actinoplanes sp. NBRC 101535]GLY06533.1 hypothetical protein Acsp01_69120 [Actinoplanes sp. NBRC 101535]